MALIGTEQALNGRLDQLWTATEWILACVGLLVRDDASPRGRTRPKKCVRQFGATPVGASMLLGARRRKGPVRTSWVGRSGQQVRVRAYPRQLTRKFGTVCNSTVRASATFSPLRVERRNVEVELVPRLVPGRFDKHADVPARGNLLTDVGDGPRHPSILG